MSSIYSLTLQSNVSIIFTAGTILLFMLTGIRFEYPPLYDGVLDTVDLGVSNEAMDLLRRMFRLHPEDRMSLEEIRNHPFLQGWGIKVPWPT